MAWLPRVAARHRVDVTIAQNFTPAWGRCAVFIHDVLFQSNPEWFSSLERAYLKPIPAMARRASVVFTSSQSEADRIAAYNPRLTRVVPIGLAVKSPLLQSDPVRPDLGPGIDAFLLSVGRLNVRKNLRTALAAAVASGAISPTRPMLVVGAPDGPAESFGPQVSAAIERGAIRFLGALSDAEVAWLYGHADCLLFLTRGEGFGLPPLEAQTFGCPVIVSDLPVMREVCRDGAVFVDPDDVTGAAQAIRDVLAAGRGAPSPPPSDPWLGIVERMREAIDQVPAGSWP